MFTFGSVSFEVLCGPPPIAAEPPEMPAYEALLALCPDNVWKRPWDFVPCDADCRGHIRDPEPALAALRKGYSDEVLTQARILVRSDCDGMRLNPSLCDPAGAVVALRAGSSRKANELLTSGGCLSGRAVPAFAARYDARNDFSMGLTQTLFATSSVREVALLRGLGFAATFSHGLDRLSEPSLRTVNNAFDMYTPAKGRLVLVGWELLRLQRTVPPALAAVANHLAGAQAHLRLELPGIRVWYPSAEFVENLHYRLRLRDFGCVRKLLDEHNHDLHQLHLFAGEPGSCRVKPAEPADFAEAQAKLLAELGQSRDHLSEFAERAQRHYDALTQRDLVEMSLVHGGPAPTVDHLVAWSHDRESALSCQHLWGTAS